MVQFSRCWGTLVVAASVVAAFAALDGLLALAAGRSPSWLRGDRQPNEWEDLDDAGKKLSGVAAMGQQGGATNPRLGLLFGRSALREGVDPKVLDAHGPSGHRWLSLYGHGNSYTYMEPIAELVSVADLRPDLVVIAGNQAMLVGQPNLPAPAVSMPARAVWGLSHRHALNQSFRRFLYRRRLQLLTGCGQGIEALFAPDPSPWDVQLSGKAYREMMELEWDAAQKLGWFDPKPYTTEGPQAASLARMIAAFRSRGAQVIVVLLPERKAWRSAVPPEAKTCLLALLEARFSPDAPPLIDLRDALEEEMFLDYNHVSEHGRKALSVLLADRLKSILEPGPAAR
jgi:hypothetical protein